MIMTHDNPPVERVTAAGREALELTFTWWQEHRAYMAELHAATGLSPMEVHALRALDVQAPMATLELASQIHCEPSNITMVVDRLDRAGLIERRPHPDDRRVRLITLTERGRTAQAEVDAYLSTPPVAINRLTATDQRALRDLLLKMVG
jgi:MarR family transcriptional regulator, organic hydroperoxide resistance regulator